MNYRRIATVTGWLWIITFVTSIPARLFFYAPVLDNEGNYVTGAGNDAQTLIATGHCSSVAVAWVPAAAEVPALASPTRSASAWRRAQRARRPA